MGTNSLIDTLAAIYDSPKSIQSDFFRANAQEVARLASLGLITTALKGSYGTVWRPTFKGLRVLEQGEGE